VLGGHMSTLPRWLALNLGTAHTGFPRFEGSAIEHLALRLFPRPRL
jgi:hypothetical protein